MFFFRFTFQYFGAIIHSLSFLDAVVRCGWLDWEDEASRCCEFTDRENGPRIFFDILASKLGRYFTGIAAETSAAIFPVKRRYRRYFSS